jgi:hypothetical protein
MSHIDKKHIVRGVEGGLIAGVAFGAMLGMMGIFDFISTMSYAPTAFLFFVHILLSIGAGILFSVTFGAHINTDAKGLLYGCFYGFILWTISTLIMWFALKNIVNLYGPAMFLPALWGHLIYGFLLGIIYNVIVPDKEQIDK